MHPLRLRDLKLSSLPRRHIHLQSAYRLRRGHDVRVHVICVQLPGCDAWLPVAKVRELRSAVPNAQFAPCTRFAGIPDLGVRFEWSSGVAFLRDFEDGFRLRHGDAYHWVSERTFRTVGASA
jgi:hypothetical protein